MSLGKNQPFEEVSWHIYTFAPRCALCMSRLLRSHGPRITWPVSRDPRRRGQNKAGGDVSLLSQKGHQGSWGKTHLGPGTSSGWRRRRRRWPLVTVGVPCQRYRQGHPDLAHWLSWGHHWSCIVAQSTQHNRQSGGGMNNLQLLTLLTLSLLLMFPPAPLSTSLLSPKHCVTPTKVLDGKFHTNITSSEQQKRALVFFDKIRTCSRVCGVEGVGSVWVAARDRNAWRARTDCSPPTDLRPRAEWRPSVRRDSYSSLILEQNRPRIFFTQAHHRFIIISSI